MPSIVDADLFNDLLDGLTTLGASISLPSVETPDYHKMYNLISRRNRAERLRRYEMRSKNKTVVIVLIGLGREWINFPTELLK